MSQVALSRTARCLLLTLALVLAPALANAASIPEQRCSDFTNSHSIQDFPSGATGSIPYQQCTILVGSLSVVCSNGVTISSLSIFANVHTIEGDVTVQNCPDLASLDGLDALTRIEGDLTIVNNNILTDIRALENLAVVTGSVRVYRNPNLCYIDLMRFDRVSDDVDFQQIPNCLETLCDASCGCGFCGSSRECAAQCPDPDLTWIAAPVVVGVVLIALLVFFILRSCKRDDCACDCFFSLKHPVEVEYFDKEEALPMRSFPPPTTSQPKRFSEPHKPVQVVQNHPRPRQAQAFAKPPPSSTSTQLRAAPQNIRLPRLKSQQTASTPSRQPILARDTTSSSFA